MIELPTILVAFLVMYATIGFFTFLGWFAPRRSRIRLDSTVNSKRHLLVCGLVSQAHRQGDPEF